MNLSHGFTYLEVLLALVVLAAASITASQALLSVHDQDENRSRTMMAEHLLQDGIAVVRCLPRLDSTSPVFGVEADDTTIDDVDDLHRVTQTGPTDLSGLAFESSWQRAYRVDSADVAVPTSDVAPAASSLLRVRITVLCDGAELATSTLLLARTP